MERTPPAGSTGRLTSTPPSRRCTNCGAPLRYDPGTGDLRCRHCRGSEAIAGSPADASIVLAYEAVVGAGASTDDDVEQVQLQCDDCGAPSTYPPNTIATSCPYCRTPFVGAPTSTRSLRPGGVVPLTITEEQARANTRAWLGNRWFAPRHLDKVATGALHSGYTPAWVFSMSTTAGYRGRRGDNYQDTETYTTTDSNGNTTTQTRTVTKIRWRPASGTVHRNFDGVTAFAGTDPLSQFGEDLEPWGVDDVQAYADDFLRGSTAQSYTRPPAAGLRRARERTTDALEAAIRADIGGDHQEIHDVDRRDRDIRMRYLLLPGWEATYQHRDQTYQLAVNGRTGEVAGTRPYSKVKIAIAVGVAVAAIALVVFLVVRNRDTTPTPAPTSVSTTTPTTSVPTTSAPTAPTSSTPTASTALDEPTPEGEADDAAAPPTTGAPASLPTSPLGARAPPGPSPLLRVAA